MLENKSYILLIFRWNLNAKIVQKNQNVFHCKARFVFHVVDSNESLVWMMIKLQNRYVCFQREQVSVEIQTAWKCSILVLSSVNGVNFCQLPCLFVYLCSCEAISSHSRTTRLLSFLKEDLCSGFVKKEKVSCYIFSFLKSIDFPWELTAYL